MILNPYLNYEAETQLVARVGPRKFSNQQFTPLTSCPIFFGSFYNANS